MEKLTTPQAFTSALQHFQGGRLADAESICRQILRVDKDHGDALHLLGMIAGHVGRSDLAAELLRRAIALHPSVLEYRNSLAGVLEAAGRCEEAVVIYRSAIGLHPGSAPLRSNLGGTLVTLGELTAAAAEFRAALTLDSNLPEAYYNLAHVLNELGEMEAAITECRHALRLRPDFAEAFNLLGNSLLELDRNQQAIDAFHAALKHRPEWGVAYNNLGNAFNSAGDRESALGAYRKAVEVNPSLAQARYNLATALMFQGSTEEAVSEFRASLLLQPNDPKTHSNLGNALKDQGKLDEAIECYRHSMRLSPSGAAFHSNLVHTLHFHPGYSGRAIREEQERWNLQHATPLAAERRPHKNKPDLERRLKVGYVSPDFCGHSIAFFIAPLLAAHDRAQVEVYCYSSVQHPDVITERLRGLSDVWCDARLLSDEQLSQRIREDGIDLLVDLTMHTANNRLLVFARKPAPCQISWLAYPGSTGLETMDYRLTDALMEPADIAEASPERPMRLPDSWCCHQPIDDQEEVGSLPAAKQGYVTFGSLHNFAKVNEAVLRCWSRVMAATPNSRLLLYCPAGETRKRVAKLFDAAGVAADRLEFAGRGPWAHYAALHRRIDIGLDTYPCNGMTITCHNLWFGIPVITLPGNTPVSRAGLSLLSTVGLTELVASSEEDYVRIAVDLANDLSKLIELRATLRARLQASPLMDAPRFARNVETAYRTIWREWCQRACGS